MKFVSLLLVSIIVPKFILMSLQIEEESENKTTDFKQPITTMTCFQVYIFPSISFCVSRKSFGKYQQQYFVCFYSIGIDTGWLISLVTRENNNSIKNRKCKKYRDEIKIKFLPRTFIPRISRVCWLYKKSIHAWLILSICRVSVFLAFYIKLLNKFLLRSKPQKPRQADLCHLFSDPPCLSI